MSYLDLGARARIQARITRNEAALEKAYDARDSALDPERAVIQSYKLNTGEGEQFASHRKLDEIQKIITTLENQIQRDANRLNGTGIVNMNLRRRL